MAVSTRRDGLATSGRSTPPCQCSKAWKNPGALASIPCTLATILPVVERVKRVSSTSARPRLNLTQIPIRRLIHRFPGKIKQPKLIPRVWFQTGRHLMRSGREPLTVCLVPLIPPRRGTWAFVVAVGEDDEEAADAILARGDHVQMLAWATSHIIAKLREEDMDPVAYGQAIVDITQKEASGGVAGAADTA